MYDVIKTSECTPLQYMSTPYLLYVAERAIGQHYSTARPYSHDDARECCFLSWEIPKPIHPYHCVWFRCLIVTCLWSDTNIRLDITILDSSWNIFHATDLLKLSSGRCQLLVCNRGYDINQIWQTQASTRCADSGNSPTFLVFTMAQIAWGTICSSVCRRRAQKHL